MAERFYFKARFSWGASFTALDDASVAAITRAIWKLASTGEDSEMTGVSAVLWPVIRSELIADGIDAMNGSLGGRPRKETVCDESRAEHSRAQQSMGVFDGLKPIENPTETGVSGEKKRRKQKTDIPGFDRFYAAYPKHQGRADALKAWNALGPDEMLQNAIMAAVNSQRENPEWRKENGKYIPMPARWLREKRWEDESKPLKNNHLGVQL